MNTHPDTTDHPLTETDAAELWDAHRSPNASPFHEQGSLYVRSQTAMLRAAFDAGREHERTNPDDDRPWEPLNGPVRVGDEVRRDHRGTTTIGFVGRVGLNGALWTTEDAPIGRPDIGTWYVRRTVQEPPTTSCAVIVTADGRKYIEATAGGAVWYANEAVLGPDNRWHGVWRTDSGRVTISSVSPGDITPDTWNVEEE